MTDNEIIKALTDCVEALCDCRVCHFNRMHRDEFENCVDVALEQALSLINRQKAEIEALEKNVDDGEAEIEAVKRRCDVALSLMERKEECIKAEAIKEFVDTLESVAYVSSDWSHGEHPRVVEMDDVYNIKEEMVGDPE